MAIYPVGEAMNLSDIPKGSIFWGQVNDIPSLFIRCSVNTGYSQQIIDGACVLGLEYGGYQNGPGIFYDNAFSGNRFFVLNNSFIKPNNLSINLSYRSYSCGDVVYYGSDAFISTASGQFGSHLVNIDTGAELEGRPDKPRAIFKRWSVVQRIFDREEVLFTYEPAPAR